ncbi:MAG: DUF4446 family protein [Thermoleophilia bacterium]
MEPYAIAASAAAAPGVIALVVVGLLAVRLRRLRAGQNTLLPDGTSVPLVDRQAELSGQLDDVRTALNDLRAQVDRQAEITVRELGKSLRFQGLVRYDAYGDMGGSQSWSIALLNESKTGTVISCLHARDHARVYIKDVEEGTSPQRLSPEEERAIALAGGAQPRQEAA